MNAKVLSSHYFMKFFFSKKEVCEIKETDGSIDRIPRSVF
jgi:hypothetical protein